jgi:hypothetical protein
LEQEITKKNQEQEKLQPPLETQHQDMLEMLMRLKTVTKKKKQEAAAKMEMYTQYHFGWMEWADAFDNQARYLPEDSDEDWVEACKQSDLCAHHAEHALKAAHHFQASTSTAVLPSHHRNLPPC